MDIVVRELRNTDIPLVADYWHQRSDQQLLGMGVDLTKRPNPSELAEMLEAQRRLPYQLRQSYCLIWEIDGLAAGHCNINKINFAQEAFMHLHLWRSDDRKKGLGTAFVRKSLRFFFENYELQVLYCEPFAMNQAPNKTLARVGFCFVKQYITIPGPINYEQPVCRWQLSRDDYVRRIMPAEVY